MKELFTTEGFGDRCFTFLSNTQGRILYKNTYNKEFLDGFNIISSITSSAKIIKYGTLKDIEKNFKKGKKSVYEICYDKEKLSVVEMTGSEIKKLIDKGFDLYGDGNTYKYSCFVKNDKELKDDKIYKVVAGTEEFTQDIQKKAKVLDITTKNAVCDYVKTLGEFEAKDIKW